MKKLYVLFIAICALNFCSCSTEILLSANDYCLIKEVCDPNTKQCQKARCEDEYSHKCGNDFCSINKYACHNIHVWSISLERAKSLNLIENQYKQFHDFYSKIPNCPLKTKEIRPDEVCLNSAKCVYRPQIWSWVHVPLKYNLCPCNRGKFRTQCLNGEFCALDNSVCDVLKFKGLEKSLSDASNMGIKKCHV